MDFDDGKVPVILIIDDVEMNASLLKQMIQKMGYVAHIALNAEEAVLRIREEIPHLILLDIVMPEISGYQFCEILKQDTSTKDIPVIFVSAIDAVENKKKAFELGGVDFITKPYSFAEVSLRVNLQLKLYKTQKELEYSNRRLSLIVNEQAQLIEAEQKRMLYAIAMFSGSSKRLCNENHIQNISENSRLIAQALNFTKKYENKISSEFVERIEAASKMHDIGKISVPDCIIQKKEALNEDEAKLLRKHVETGVDIIKEIYPEYGSNEFMKMTVDIIANHHERWDGKGYPKGIGGEEIPLAARIVSLVNYYDKMVKERFYKPAYSKEKSIEIINSESGKRFDPCIVDLFNKVVKQMKTD